MLLPYLIVAIFIAAQAIFALMLRRRQNVTIHNDIDVTKIVDWFNAHTEQHEGELTTTLRDLFERVHEEGKLTRKETQELKTALRDDEKTDQRQKAKARAKKARK